MDLLKFLSPALKAQPVYIPDGNGNLRGDLILPEHPEGLVLFLRIDGGYSDYPQDRVIAAVFAKHKLATLLLNFPAKPTRAMMRSIIQWTKENPATAGLPVGSFGAGIDSATAVDLAINEEGLFQAMVFCDSEVEMNDQWHSVAVPMLFITGNDQKIRQLNQLVLEKVKGTASLNMIPHATYVFESPRAMEEGAQLAALWFAGNMVKVSS